MQNPFTLVLCTTIIRLEADNFRNSIWFDDFINNSRSKCVVMLNYIRLSGISSDMVILQTCMLHVQCSQYWDLLKWMDWGSYLNSCVRFSEKSIWYISLCVFAVSKIVGQWALSLQIWKLCAMYSFLILFNFCKMSLNDNWCSTRSVLFDFFYLLLLVNILRSDFFKLTNLY